MSEQELLSLCESEGITVEQLRQTIRISSLQKQKSRIIVHMRDKLMMSFGEIAECCHYYDRSGAKQAYDYAKQIL